MVDLGGHSTRGSLPTTHATRIGRLSQQQVGNRRQGVDFGNITEANSLLYRPRSDGRTEVAGLTELFLN